MDRWWRELREVKMKRSIFIIACLMLFSTPLFAGTWCEWSGTEGINCKSDSRGYITLPSGLRVSIDQVNFNSHGYYERITTQPTIGTDQVRDAEVWGFADNQISLTWTVRDLTAQEILERDASAMPLSEYYLWKAIVAGGLFTSAQVVTYLTANAPELVDAYQARKTIDEQ